MRSLIPVFLYLVCLSGFSQDDYQRARNCYDQGKFDSARYYINKNLARKPDAQDYFLSGMIHEAQNANLRALADYEAVTKRDFSNLEAHFQKGLIYYHTASYKPAIDDFSYVINNQSGSSTNAVYFTQDPNGIKGTFLSSLQTMMGRVHQYRGMAYQMTGEDEKALNDFNVALTYDSSAEVYINRALLFSKMDRSSSAIRDLKYAIELEPGNYLAWYNLAILDPKARLPVELLNSDEFLPMLNLIGANAFESGNYAQSAQYYSKVLKEKPKDDLALIGRGKAFLKLESYDQARKDFLTAIQESPERVEALYLIGNSFFYEEKYDQAIGFYNQYLSIDPFYATIWYNAAMAYLNIEEKPKACQYLKKADLHGMKAAQELLDQTCDSQ